MRLLLLLALSLPTGLAADPLFDSNERLALELRAPIADLRRDRDKSLSYPAQVVVRQDGAEFIVPAEVRARGNSRLRRDVCRFPPLWLSFSKRDVAGTLFAGQKRLKLVTQCDPTSTRDAALLEKEYLAYRMLNQITPLSFRVRPLSVTYRDTGGGRAIEGAAFLIEHKRRLARRLDLESVSIEQTSAVALDQQFMNLVSLFQFMIGNVDWSATSGGTGDCCHNFALFSREDEPLVAIPYDFDRAGLVNADYAKPDPRLGQDRITDRRYRGYCRNNGFLSANFALFQEARPIFMALIDESALPKRERRQARRYVEQFFDIIAEPKRVSYFIERYCHKSRFVEVHEQAEDE